MEDKKVIGLINRGWTGHMIKQKFINDKNCSTFEYREVGVEDKPEAFLNEIRRLGFAEVGKHNSEEEFVSGYFKKTTLWTFQKDDFRIEFTWSEHLKSEERDYEIEFVLPSDLKVRLWISDEPLSRQIAGIIEEWPKIQREQDGLDLQIKRLRNKMADEARRIGEWILVLLKGRNWEHCILRNSGETLLRIKFQHSRYLEIKLQEYKSLPNPVALAKKIKKVMKAFDAIDGVNLSIRNYVRESMWEKPQENDTEK